MTKLTVSSAKLRSNLAEILNEVSNGEIITVKRRGQSDVSIIDQDTLDDLVTMNNPRIIKEIAKARQEKGGTSLDELLKEFE